MCEAGAVTHGVLLAAGAGSRMGRPKALVEDWLGGADAADVLPDAAKMARYAVVRP